LDAEYLLFGVDELVFGVFPVKNVGETLRTTKRVITTRIPTKTATQYSGEKDAVVVGCGISTVWC
jgi:hypothetical protein